MVQRKVVLFLMVLVVLTACGDPEPLRIGLVGTLSGRHSEIGVSARNGAQIRVDEFNESGGLDGRQVVLVPYDNLGDPETCREILDSMMDDGIKFVLGPLFSQMAEVTLKAIEGKDVLVVSPTMSTDYLTGKDDNLIRTSSTTKIQAEMLVDRAQEMGLKTFAVVYDLSNRKYTEVLYHRFREKAPEMGIRVTFVEALEKGVSPKMLPVAQKIVAEKPDGVLMCLSAIDAANLSQQIRKLGGKMQFFGVSWSQTDDLLTQGGRAVEGMILIAIRPYGIPLPRMEAFEHKYYQRYKKNASFVSGRAYDSTSLLLEGLQQAESLKPDLVKKKILSFDGFPGLSATIRFDQYGDVLKGYNLVKVFDGEYVSAD